MSANYVKYLNVQNTIIKVVYCSDVLEQSKPNSNFIS